MRPDLQDALITLLIAASGVISAFLAKVLKHVRAVNAAVTNVPEGTPPLVDRIHASEITQARTTAELTGITVELTALSGKLSTLSTQVRTLTQEMHSLRATLTAIIEIRRPEP